MSITIKKYLWPAKEVNAFNNVPWGYKLQGDCYIPIPHWLDMLEAAKREVLNGESLRRMSEWLTEKSGKRFSHMGLKNRQRYDNKYFKTIDPDKDQIVYWDGDIKPDEFPLPTTPFGEKSARQTDRQFIRSQNSELAKQIAKEKIKARNAQVQLTRSKNQMKKLAKTAENDPELFAEVKGVVNEELTSLEENVEVIFKPNEGPQTDFLASPEDEVFYGGAKGGGKTYALVADVLKHIHNPEFRGILFRQTTQALREVERAAQKLYNNDLVKGKYNKQDRVWSFPSGAVLEFGYGENEDDVERYRGNQYSWLGFDELPQWPTDAVYNAMKSCVRVTKGSNLQTYIRASGNPGNVGSPWVKKYFIDPAPPNTTFFRVNEVRNPVLNQKITTKTSLRYIPATLFDNPMVDQEQYLAQLADLPEKKRKQLLEGNWDIVEGSAFSEFDRDIHVCKAFNIPSSWMKFRAADWGFSSPFCCLWFAVDWDGNIYVYREYYGSGIYDADWATEICAKEMESVKYGIIDGSTDSNRGERSPSTFETVNKILRQHKKVKFSKADRSPNSRISGKQRVHEALAMIETGQLDDNNVPVKKPRLQIFENCTNLIRTMPVLVLDKNDPEKVAKDQEDHAYDALRYGLMSRPKTPKRDFIRQTVQASEPTVRDPFSIYGR